MSSNDRSNREKVLADLATIRANLEGSGIMSQLVDVFINRNDELQYKLLKFFKEFGDFPKDKSPKIEARASLPAVVSYLGITLTLRAFDDLLQNPVQLIDVKMEEQKDIDLFLVRKLQEQLDLYKAIIK